MNLHFNSLEKVKMIALIHAARKQHRNDTNYLLFTIYLLLQIIVNYIHILTHSHFYQVITH